MDVLTLSVMRIRGRKISAASASLSSPPARAKTRRGQHCTEDQTPLTTEHDKTIVSRKLDFEGGPGQSSEVTPIAASTPDANVSESVRGGEEEEESVQDGVAVNEVDLTTAQRGWEKT